MLENLDEGSRIRFIEHMAMAGQVRARSGPAQELLANAERSGQQEFEHRDDHTEDDRQIPQGSKGGTKSRPRRGGQMTSSKDAQGKGEPSSMEQQFTKLSVAAYEILGIPGRMLCRSKSMRTPTTICNANIFNVHAEKIWFGDIDIERDEETLIQLAESEGTLYILYEMDDRFLDHLPSSEYIRSVAAVIVERGDIRYSKDFKKYVKFRQNLKKRIT